MTEKTSKNSENTIDDTLVDQTENLNLDPLSHDQPKKQMWPYLGKDSTSVIDVVSMPPEEEEDDITRSVDEWCSNQSMSKEEVVPSGITLVSKVATKYNKALSSTGKLLADYAILIGKVCNKIQQSAVKPGEKSEVWANEYLPFLSPRNRQKYMFLASRKDCYQYTFLGVDRLEHLCSVTKDSDEKDPIGSLLEKYEIKFDPEVDAESSLAEFKTLVDAAYNSARLVNKRIETDHELVKDLTQLGTKFDGSLIRTLKDIKKSGGNPETYLKELLANGGKKSLDEEDNGKDHLKDFNSLSSELINAINYIVRDPDQISKIDKDTLLDLEKKVSELKEAANLTKKAA